MNTQEIYEKQTGEKATYLIGASTYHTLKYVRWLEQSLSKDIEVLEKHLSEIHKLTMKDLNASVIVAFVNTYVKEEMDKLKQTT